MKEDPYQAFRDSRGRFTNGNPGRLMKTFTWLSDKEFKVVYPFLNIVSPSPCPDCGGLEYRFNARWDNKNAYLICARCNNCNQRRWYKPYRETWSEL